MKPQAPLPDGAHDAVVVDATEVGDALDELSVDLLVVSGGHKGEVVTIRARGWHHDAITVLGLPATITVDGGTPSVVVED